MEAVRPGAHAPFPPSSRIRKRADFLAVQRGSAFPVRANTFLMLLAPAPVGVAGPRLGLVVGRKFGSSPLRARFKRLVREWFRHHKDWFAGPLEVLVIARGAAPDKSLDGLRAELMATEARAKRGARELLARRNTA